MLNTMPAYSWTQGLAQMLGGSPMSGYGQMPGSGFPNNYGQMPGSQQNAGAADNPFTGVSQIVQALMKKSQNAGQPLNILPSGQ